MTNRIISVKPIGKTKLLATFQNGTEKSYDVKLLFDMFPQMQILEKDKALFDNVSLDTGGYGISWNDELDIDSEEIWENGIDVGKTNTDILLNVGYNLASARESIGMTQKELSNKTNIDQANISKIERGIINSSLSTLKKLADGMDMQLKIKFIPK